MIEAVISRLQERVQALNNRTEGAAQFAALMQSNSLPQQTPAAHVIPLGLQGGKSEAAASAFLQRYVEAIAVILTVRSHSATGKRSLSSIDTLIWEVVEALAGWAPGAEIGVFELARAQLVSMQTGTLVYQIEFRINDQLRIVT